MPVVVRGYHGTTLPDAQKLVKKRTMRWQVQPYHWLGQGIYFWEGAPVRAWAWALYRARKEQEKPALISAFITLRNCLDLLDIDGWRYIRSAHQLLHLMHQIDGTDIERQQPPFYCDHQSRSRRHHLNPQVPDPNLLQNFNYLDCAVTDLAVMLAEGVSGKTVASVRAAFLEGQQLFQNSFFFDRNHVQIAVRDPGMISDLIIEPEASLRRRFRTVSF